MFSFHPPKGPARAAPPFSSQESRVSQNSRKVATVKFMKFIVWRNRAQVASSPRTESILKGAQAFIART
jgi:hypothetical protein